MEFQPMLKDEMKMLDLDMPILNLNLLHFLTVQQAMVLHYNKPKVKFVVYLKKNHDLEQQYFFGQTYGFMNFDVMKEQTKMQII